MAQFSVPIALLSSVDLGTNPNGILLGGTPADDVSANPVVTNPANGIQLQRTGGATIVDCVDDDNAAKFFTDSNNGSEPIGNPNGESFIIAFSGQALLDPGVDTDHKINLMIRRNGAVPGGSYSAFLGLYSGADLVNPVVFTAIEGLIPIDFTPIVITLSAPEVQDFRSKGGYLSGPAFYLGFTADEPFPTPITTTFDFALFQLEAPDSGPSPDIEITSDGGLIFGGSNYTEFTSTAGLVFDFSAESGPLFNEFISDAGLTFAGGGLGAGNQFTSDAGLIFGSGAVIVLSVDASGIYTLVPGKKFDTLYARNGSDRTEDVQIPDPIWKTGYIGG